MNQSRFGHPIHTDSHVRITPPLPNAIAGGPDADSETAGEPERLSRRRSSTELQVWGVNRPGGV